MGRSITSCLVHNHFRCRHTHLLSSSRACFSRLQKPQILI
ncbi:unnamed protein product, partial [Amoebophrya sp. A25]|eukprot:GSA25T00015090001.1